MEFAARIIEIRKDYVVRGRLVFGWDYFDPGGAPGSGAYPYESDGEAIGCTAMFEALRDDLERGEDPDRIAARFHGFLAEAFADAATATADAFFADTVALSGGCFQNVTLLKMVMEALPDLRLCGPGMVPANDGGLAFGQALVALARLEGH